MKNADQSFEYKLRLMLAHRDILRSKIPFITKRYIQSFRKSQLSAARRLRDKDCIDVAFFLTIPGMWKADYLFEVMRKSPHYHPYVVIYPYSQYKGFSKEEVEDTIKRTEIFVKSRGI